MKLRKALLGIFAVVSILSATAAAAMVPIHCQTCTIQSDGTAVCNNCTIG